MILVNNDNIVIASAELIERVDTQDESGLIKVHTDDGGFYYIGTTDRYTYQIINIYAPTTTDIWSYNNQEFTKIIGATA